ncbi:Ribosomal RNA large subunit methyltransferase E, partial [Trema orientale]
VACQSLGPLTKGGVVVGIDIKKVKVPQLYCDSRAQTVCADVMKLPRNRIRALSPQKGFSVILSDMCPPVSGITTKDSALSVELGMRALDIAVGRASLEQTEANLEGSVTCLDDENDSGLLKEGGHLVIKLLESEDGQEFSRICKPLFRKASWLRPKATRSSSREIYLICQGLQSQAQK